MSATPSLAYDFYVKALNSIQCDSQDGICRAYAFKVNSIGQIVRDGQTALVFGYPSSASGQNTPNVQIPRYSDGRPVEASAWSLFLRGFGPKEDGKYTHMFCVRARNLGFSSGLNGEQVYIVASANSLLGSVRAVDTYQRSRRPLCT